MQVIVEKSPQKTTFLQCKSDQNTTITRNSGTVFKFYYYGARYLDPRTSRWISADPAVGDYIPQAPTDDDARKRNGNLPGMGGVYNLVNLHVYHYAGNNPVKYVDPDGRESGLVIDENAVSGFGHAGMYVQTEKGYSFFEVAEITESIEKEQELGKAEILSQSNLELPTIGSARKAGRGTEAGVIRRDFATKEEMDEHLAKNGYTVALEFKTSEAQDKKIFDAAMEQGKSYHGYNVIKDNCVTWARSVLATQGSGINSGINANNISNIFVHSVPNYSLPRMQFANPGSKQKRFK